MITADMVRSLIAGEDRERPRSKQRAVGPSDLSSPCSRKLMYQILNVDRVVADEVNLAAWVGTGIHAQMERAVKRHDDWEAEQKVGVEVAKGIRLFGTLDAYHKPSHTIVDWKGQPLDTPIPTPDGWTTMGDLKVGDRVFDANGEVCTVVGKSPIWTDRETYKVTFDDGEVAYCDGEHEWVFDIPQQKRPARRVTMRTDEAVQHVWSKAKSPQRQLRVATNGPLILPDADLPVPPYTLGAWLGDGHSRTGLITKPDDDLFVNIEADGYSVKPATEAMPITRRVIGLTDDLRAAGLLENKHIPERYLRASRSQRLALLQGLMDTDGSWNKIRNQAVFCTSRSDLANDVAELVSSLGWKPRVWELTKRGFGLTVTAYDVTFVPHDMNPFRMTRKAELVRMSGSARSRFRIVKSIELVDHIDTVCLGVDSPTHTYLTGRAMIPTHNSVGPSALQKYRRGTPDNYRTQVAIYGLLAVLSGKYRVDNTAIVYIPRNGSMSDIHVDVHPWDQERADAAVKRLVDLHAASAAGPAVLPLLPTADDCMFCPHKLPGSDRLEIGCPGHNPTDSTGYPAAWEPKEREATS